MPKHQFIGGAPPPIEIIYDQMLGIRMTTNTGSFGEENIGVWDGNDYDPQIDSISQWWPQTGGGGTGHIVFSPDRQTMWASTRRGITNVWQWAVWDTNTWARIRALQVSGRWGAWSPDGNYFAVSNNLGFNQPTRIYNSNYSQIATFRHNPVINFTGGKLSFNADGTKIADSEGNKIYVSEVGNWGNFFEVPVGGGWAVFHPTDPNILLCQSNVVDISIPPGTVINSLDPEPLYPQDFVFSPIGDRVAVAMRRVDVEDTNEPIVRVYRTTDWNQTVGPSVGSFPATSVIAYGLDWSHDGERLAVAFGDQTEHNPANAGVNVYLTDAAFIYAGSPVNPMPSAPFGRVQYVAWG